MIIDFKEIDSYYINLEKDIDKKEHSEHVLKSIGFKTVNRVNAEVNLTHKRFGITESFIKSLNICKEIGRYPFAIFEDDIVLLDKYENIKVPEDTDALYVGISPWGVVPNEPLGIYNSISAKKIDNNIYKIYNMLSAHGIIYISNIYVDFLINSLPKSIEYMCNQDIIRAESQKFFNIYALNSPMVYQSDTTQTKVKMSELNLINPNGFSYKQSYTFNSWDGKINE